MMGFFFFFSFTLTESNLQQAVSETDFYRLADGLGSGDGLRGTQLSAPRRPSRCD